MSVCMCAHARRAIEILLFIACNNNERAFPVVKPYAKRRHAGRKIFKANPYIYSKAPDDQLSLLAHNTEGCRDCISTAEPCRPTAPTYLQIPPSAPVDCDEHVRVYATSRNHLNDKEMRFYVIFLFLCFLLSIFGTKQM